MTRPVPVILTAIFLGLLAALQFLFAALLTFTGFLALHKGLPASPTPGPFGPSLLPIVTFAMSLVLAAFAVWSILTLIGLVRMQSRARNSVLVIAGLIAAFGGISMVTAFAMPFLMSSMPAAANPPAAGPGALRIVFFVTGTIYGIFTAIGVAVLVYFNLAKTRALFLQNGPVISGPPNTSNGRPRPAAITVISWLYLISAPFCLIYTFLPLPGFLFGFVWQGMAAHLLYATFSGLTFVLGYGLYRLWNWARLAIFAWFGVGMVNALVLITPWGRSQFHAYMDAFNANMYRYPGPQPPSNLAASPAFIGFFVVLGLGFCILILWFLHRHRRAFTPAPPAPPMPSAPEALPG